MSVSTTAIAVEGVLLALAILFIVALLRSHAEILRRLGALEGDPPPGHARGAPGSGEERQVTATDIAGQSLLGDVVRIGLGADSPPTLLAFLSSGCAACGPLWSGLSEPIPLPGDARLVVVTKGPERERLARLLKLAPSGVEVIMSTEAWDDFAIQATPHFVLVDGGQGVVGRGSASSWRQIATLLGDARDDSDLHRARTTAQRAARAEQVLAESGITAGHPSLYPSGRLAQERE